MGSTDLKLVKKNCQAPSIKILNIPKIQLLIRNAQITNRVVFGSEFSKKVTDKKINSSQLMLFLGHQCSV